jgi:hypothetical protein
LPLRKVLRTYFGERWISRVGVVAIAIIVVATGRAAVAALNITVAFITVQKIRRISWVGVLVAAAIIVATGRAAVFTIASITEQKIRWISWVGVVAIVVVVAAGRAAVARFNITVTFITLKKSKKNKKIMYSLKPVKKLKMYRYEIQHIFFCNLKSFSSQKLHRYFIK